MSADRTSASAVLNSERQARAGPSLRGSSSCGMKASRSTGGEWDDWSSTTDWSTPAAPTSTASAPPAGRPAAAGHQPYVYQPAAQPQPPPAPAAPPTQPAYHYQPAMPPAPRPAPAPAPPQPDYMQPMQPQPDYMQPMRPQADYMQPMQPTPQPAHAATPGMQLPTGYTGNLFTPGVGGGVSGGGDGGDSAWSGGDLANAAGAALGFDASKVQQVAAGVALDALRGGGMTTLEGAIKHGVSQATTIGLQSSRLAVLRYYFDVNNAYVLRKLRILCLPYRHSDWERKIDPQGSGTALPPSADFNAPDLYLPLMGLTTYVLTAGYISGADGRFTPEALGTSFSSGIAIICLEVVLIKLALYLLQSDGASAPVLDIASCSGYKFIAAVLVLLLKTVLGSAAGFAAIALAGANIGTFMVRTIQQCLQQGSGFTPGFMTDGMGSPNSKEKKQKQNLSLFAIAFLQPLFFWYLSCV